MSVVNLSNFQPVHSTPLNASQVHHQLAEHERIIDSHLVRITRLQMLLNLEEARLLRSQEEQRELRSLLKDEDFQIEF